ncbi:MAG: hypothetical protein H7831_01430 [Magnetococcus sp. WYHC-3]
MSEMIQVAGMVGLSLVYGFCAWGWGRGVATWLRWPLPPVHGAVLGIVLWLGVGGGVLNLVGVMGRPAVVWLLVLGGGWGLWHLRRHPPPRDLNLGGMALATLVMIVAWLVHVASAMAHHVMVNYRDDFIRYLVFPVRMLESGSVGPDPLSNLGDHTLGGDAFLKAMALPVAELSQLVAVDGLFGLGLLLLLVFETLLVLRIPPWIGLLVTVLTLMMDPLVVNTTSVYGAAALLFFLTSLPWISSVALDASADDPAPPMMGLAVMVGLTLAALASLKTSLILVGLGWTLLLGGASLGLRPVVTWRWVALLILTGLLAIVPWLLNALPWGMLTWPRGDEAVVASVLPTAGWLARWPGLLQPLGYGFGVFFEFFPLLAGLVLWVGVGLWWRQSRPASDSLGATLTAAWSVAALLFPALLVQGVLGLFGSGFSLDNAVRYVIPVFLGMTPALWLLLPAGRLLPASARSAAVLARTRQRTGVALALLILICLPSFLGRTLQLHEQGWYVTLWHEEERNAGLHFNQWVFSDGGRDLMRDYQALVPPGEPLLVLSMFASRLDFARNPILVLSPEMGVIPWLDRPDWGDTPGWHAFLRQRLGVTHLLWDTQGYPSFEWNSLERKRDNHPVPSARTVYAALHRFHTVLQELSRHGALVHAGEGLHLYRLSEDLPVRGDGTPDGS